MDEATHPTHQERVLTRPDLKNGFGIKWSNPQLLRLERKGLFPRRFYLSQRMAVWRQADIIAWLQAKRDAAQEPDRITEKATQSRMRRRQAMVIIT